MKRDFTPDDFEDFLKQSADGLRMKAPDRVWQNLSRELGQRRRRFTTGLGIFLLVTSAAGYSIINHLSDQTVSATNQSQQNKTVPTSENPGQMTATTVAANASTVQHQQPLTKPEGRTAKVIPMFGRRSLPNLPAETPEAATLEAGNATAENEFREPEIFTPTVIDDLPTETDERTAQTAESKPAAKENDVLPLSIESVTNAYKSRGKIKRFETQLYITPTISYRKLTENKSYLRSLDPATIPGNYPGLHSSVNNYVTHKPDVGFEVGFGVKYAVSNNLKIRSGLQFNVNRYDVKAFSSSVSVATIALNNGSRVDSLNTLSTYSNLYGYKSNWLQNLSFQLSVPVGVEYLFKGSEKVRFGLATTVQPTYVIGDRAYLITTDYKNYTEVPWLIRRWNVNTSLETFVTIEGAKTRWQVGPQVRYQLLSSFVSKYPVKENLFDFGLKLGVSLNKP